CNLTLSTPLTTSGAVTLSTNRGAFLRQTTGTITASSVNLSAGINSLGLPTQPINTQTPTLTANSRGSAYVSNTGSVTLVGGSTGNGGVFSLTNLADGN